MRALIRTATLVLVGSLVALALPAQDRVSSKQERASQAFAELTARMQKLQVTLKNTDPEKAKVIGLGSKFIQEKAIAAKMKDIKELLEEESWDDAIDSCKKVVKDLNTLIDLLLKGDTRIEDLLREIERLEKFKDQVDKLIKDQKVEKDDSARAEALEKHLKDLEKAKQDLENLIEDQKELRNDANQSGLAAEPKKAEKMAETEGDLKHRAKKLAEDLKQIEEDSEDLESDAKPSDGKPGDGKPGDGKPGDGKPGDGKPGDGKPGDGKPGDGEPGDGKPGDGQPGEGKSSKSSSSSSAGGASEDMGKAQSKLQDNKPESSLEDMEKALEKLEKAKKDIEDKIDDAKRELLKLPFEQLAKKQEQTKIETDELAEDMEKSEGEGDGQNQGQPTPGKQSVQQAVPKQKSAAGQLKEYKPGKAKQDQQDAQDKLEDAKRKLEEALAQLRQQLQDEVLRSLEERFGAMLQKQKKISAKTRIIERQKQDSLTAGGGLSTALARRIETLATGEFELAAEAHGSLKLLEEDGTTAVFPDFVIEVRDDLKTVGRRLQKHNTDKATQAMQKEIVDMLEMLIDALRQQIEQNEQNGGEP